MSPPGFAVPCGATLEPSVAPALNASVGSPLAEACEALDRDDDAFALALVVLVFLAAVSDGVAGRRAR